MESREKEDPSSLWLVVGGSAILACAGAFFFALAAATGLLAASAQVVDTHSALDYAFVGAALGAFMGIGFTFRKPTRVLVASVVGGTILGAAVLYLAGACTNDIKMWAASLSVAGAALYGALSIGGVAAVCLTIANWTHEP
jgi:hypothetical protein